MRPHQYKIYKGIKGQHGAIQFTLHEPHFICTGCRAKRYRFSDLQMRDGYPSCPNCASKMEEKSGCIFVDIAPTVNKNTYDWKNKIIMALSVKDLGQLLTGARYATEGTKITIMHDPNAKKQGQGQISKNFTLYFPKGPKSGGIIRVNQSDKKGEKKQCQVPLSADELTVLMTLISAAIPRILAWT